MTPDAQDYSSFDPEWNRERNLEAFPEGRPVTLDDFAALIKLRLIAEYAPQLLTEGEAI